MEAEELTLSRVHHGHNIRRIRVEKELSQKQISDLTHLSQSSISKYEMARRIDDETLRKFSKAMNVPLELLKTMEEDAQTIVFENNTINNTDHGGANTHVGYTENENNITNLNPIDKITELYERLLKEKDEKYAALERRLENLQRKADK